MASRMPWSMLARRARVLTRCRHAWLGGIPGSSTPCSRTQGGEAFPCLHSRPSLQDRGSAPGVANNSEGLGAQPAFRRPANSRHPGAAGAGAAATAQRMRVLPAGDSSWATRHRIRDEQMRPDHGRARLQGWAGTDFWSEAASLPSIGPVLLRELTFCTLRLS
jgi:hypothetical protein